MLDLYKELGDIVANFEKENIPYALCGGLATVVYSAPRFTEDIDLLVLPGSVPAIKELVRKQGYLFEAAPVSFSNGIIQIVRLSRIDHPPSEDILMLDLVMVTPELEEVWAHRQNLEWEQGNLCVVSREGLINMKQLSDRPKDRLDLDTLLA
jgi:hypothetical protein